MGIMIVYPEPLILIISLGLLTFLTISNIPCIHIVKHFSPKKLSLILIGGFTLPFLYGGNLFALWLAQSVLIWSYILASIILLLVPHYVLR
jgi:hypothetical protein